METSTFVKQLSSNSRVVREKALETLETFLQSQEFKKAKQSRHDKLWKGLYYSMWFSDRPRPQQRLANRLGALFMLFFDPEEAETKEFTKNDKVFIKFCRAYWKILCLEWFHIDSHRLDKFLLLIRRVLFNQLKYLQSRNWCDELVRTYIEKVLQKSPLSGSGKVYNGIPLHIIDIFLDEWKRLLTGKNDELEEEGEEKTAEEVTELVKKTPLQSFIDVFIQLSEGDGVSKVLKAKIRDELLLDERLITWDIVKSDNSKSGEGEDEDQNENEWKGFD